jgi:hypothetical protein
MKTYLGWVLARAEDGTWTFTPPDDYRDPEPTDPAIGDAVFYDPWTGRTAEATPRRSDGGPVADWGAGQTGGRGEQLALAGAAGPAP